MPRLTLAPRVDLAVYYRAERDFVARSLPQCLDFYTWEAMQARYADCSSIGFELDGRPIGGILLDGDQAHIAVLPEAHGRWALLLKPALACLFSQRSAVLGCVHPLNHRCIAFMEHHGWRRLYADEHSVRYLMRPQGGTRKTAYRFREGEAVSRVAAPSNG